MARPQQIMRLYEKGVSTELEMLHALRVALADADVGAFVRRQPKTERGWSGGLPISGALPRADVTEEQQQALLAEESRQFRRGVEWFRAYLRGKGPGGCRC
jgi:hypothetical protein